MAAVTLRLPIRTCGKISTSFQALVYFQQSHQCLSNVAPTTEKVFPSVSSEPSGLRRGTGGRSSFSGKVATVFGATGFLGRHVVNQLGKIGTQVIIPYRGDSYVVNRLKLCGDLGQILFMPYNLQDEESLYKSMKYSNLVINLIGKSYETKNFPFEEVHVKGPRNIARIAKELGVQTMVHVSSLNACEKPKPIILKKGSGFLASKWRGEIAVREEFPEAIIFRPSDMYGEGDNFLRYYATSYRRTVYRFSLWKKGNETIKQPVFVSDVAKGIVHAAFDPDSVGKTYQAVGPHRYELGELIDWCYRVMLYEKRGYKRMDLRFDPTFWMRVYFSELMYNTNKFYSWERMEREYVTDKLEHYIPTLEDLGVTVTKLEDRIFFELKIYRAHAYYDPLLDDYIRPVEPAPFASQ